MAGDIQIPPLLGEEACRRWRSIFEAIGLRQTEASDRIAEYCVQLAAKEVALGEGVAASELGWSQSNISQSLKEDHAFWKSLTVFSVRMTALGVNPEQVLVGELANLRPLYRALYRFPPGFIELLIHFLDVLAAEPAQSTAPTEEVLTALEELRTAAHESQVYQQIQGMLQRGVDPRQLIDMIEAQQARQRTS